MGTKWTVVQVIRGADIQLGQGPAWWEEPFLINRGEEHVFDLRTNKLRQTLTRPPGMDTFRLTQAANGVLLASSETGDWNGTPHTHVFARGPALRIDSDNDGTIDDADDAIEDDTDKPGKIIAVNDVDGDGIPDFADGYNFSATESNDNEAAGVKFVPLVLQVPEGVDVDRAKVQFTYDASHPYSNVLPPGVSASGGYEISGGRLRLWTKDGARPATAMT